MKNIEISDDLFYYVVSKRSDEKDDFERILKRILRIHDFKSSVTRKIVLIGDAGVGKSTVRKVLFDYSDPIQLIKESLEPTRGLEYFNYGLFDMNCSVLDTSGQELYKWLDDEAGLVFSDSDFVILIIDARDFSENYQKAYELLKKVTLTAKSHSKNVVVSLFLHKMDLIAQKNIEQFKKFTNQEHKIFELAEEVDIPLFFTSILEPYIKWLNVAIIKLLKIENLLLPNYENYLNNIKK